MSTIGGRIKKIREEKNISQYRLSKLSGVAQSTISAIEAPGQTRSPAVDTVEKLAVALGCSVSDITDEEKEIPVMPDDGGRSEVVKMLLGLTPTEVQWVRDFVSGILASRAKE